MLDMMDVMTIETMIEDYDSELESIAAQLGADKLSSEDRSKLETRRKVLESCRARLKRELSLFPLDART